MVFGSRGRVLLCCGSWGAAPPPTDISVFFLYACEPDSGGCELLMTALHDTRLGGIFIS